MKCITTSAIALSLLLPSGGFSSEKYYPYSKAFDQCTLAIDLRRTDEDLETFNKKSPEYQANFCYNFLSQSNHPLDQQAIQNIDQKTFVWWVDKYLKEEPVE